MKIITTPMCEDILKMSGITDYTVVKPSEIRDADVAILLSETKCDIPVIPVKLNTYPQIFDNIFMLSDEFGTDIDENAIIRLKNLNKNNLNRKRYRKDIRVKVYSDFLKDTLLDMGFTLVDEDYDYVVMPDYMDIDVDGDNVIIVPSHKNVSRSIIKRVNKRYEFLENELCMKQ